MGDEQESRYLVEEVADDERRHLGRAKRRHRSGRRTPRRDRRRVAHLQCLAALKSGAPEEGGCGRGCVATGGVHPTIWPSTSAP